MTNTINVRRADTTTVVRVAGAVIGETREALILSEGDLAEVMYFPITDVAMAFLDASETVTTCPAKGAASHYTIQTKSGALEDAAWSYENPTEAAMRIKGHIAFDTSRVTVENV